jgi:hypothetical protein
MSAGQLDEGASHDTCKEDWPQEYEKKEYRIQRRISEPKERMGD